ncbi:DUF5906 domain-containing protein [Endozoicomonas sp.]|uniref:DUF5906 domain-containing protein n=1 Tax=Endozoicomonas sp. TaxID=1892382 RepID=UPI00383B949A
MKCNLNEAKRFLSLFAPEEHSHTFQIFDDTDDNDGSKARTINGHIDELFEQFQFFNQQRIGIFFTVNQTDGKRRTKDNIRKVRALFLDMDGAPLEPVLAKGVKPHALIESSPGRYHVYWGVDDCPLEKFKPVQKALIAKFNGDPSVNDLPRVMRLPGFNHHKYEPFLTRIMEINHELPPYQLDDLISGLGLDLSKPEKVSTAPVDPNLPLADGYRTETLTRLIGQWIRMGMNNRTILNGLQAWNNKNVERLPYDKLKKTLKSIRKLDNEKLAENEPLICELNSRYSVAPVGGKTVIIDHDSNQPFACMGFEDFKKLYISRPRIDKQTAPDYWLTHPRRRQYEEVVFQPGAPANDEIYNLWKGFTCEPAEGDCSLYLAHIRDNICNGDSVAYQYLLDWMAHTIQKPAELPGVAIVLMGKQGTGKGVYVNEFGRIFGNHFKQVSSSEQLLGRFNSLLADSLLIFLDEALWGGEKKLEGALKTLITENRRMVEFKHKDMVAMDNYNRIIMATNNDWAIPAGPDERRYLVLPVSSQHMQDTTYFQAITEQMNTGGRAALLKTLLERDISKTNIRIAPKTRALLRQKEESFSPVEAWWYGRLQEGQILDTPDNWVNEIDKRALYHNFQEHMDDRYTKENSFHPRLKRLVPTIREERPLNEFGRRTRVLKLPPLKECRSNFEAHLNQKVDWEEY